MKKTIASAKTGQKVTLTTDDTFTLAIGRERTESTPPQLAQIFTKRTLQSMCARSSNQAEQAKLDRAIALAQ